MELTTAIRNYPLIKIKHIPNLQRDKKNLQHYVNRGKKYIKIKKNPTKYISGLTKQIDIYI